MTEKETQQILQEKTEYWPFHEPLKTITSPKMPFNKLLALRITFLIYSLICNAI